MEIRETVERIEREERERHEAEAAGEEVGGYVNHDDLIWSVLTSSVGPPVWNQSTGNTPGHRFRFSECRWSAVDKVGGKPFNPPPRGRPLAEVLGNCLRADSHLPLSTGMLVRGWFHYIPGEWVWVNEAPADQLECYKWGPHQPATVNCFAHPWKSRSGLTVRGDYRLRSIFSDYVSECITIYGHLNSMIPYKVPQESIIELVNQGDEFEPYEKCNWP